MKLNNAKLKKIRITFFYKKPTTCPVCSQDFYREELLSGRGRLIVSNLTQELRTTYTKSEKYGNIYPIIYNTITCPRCFYSTFPDDFLSPIKLSLLQLREQIIYRQKLMDSVFPSLSFIHPRTLFHGLAAYILAISCYSFFEKSFSPSLKKAICSIRTAWVYNDIFDKFNTPIYQVCSNIFYEKANDFYQKSLSAAQSGSEIFENVKYGPDINNNFGYPGLIYISNLLKIRSVKKNLNFEEKLKILNESKLQISKLFGSGSSSKQKPGPLLNFSRELYSNITTKIKAIEFLIKQEFNA